MRELGQTMAWNRHTFDRRFMAHWHWVLLDYPDIERDRSRLIPTRLETDVFLMGAEL